MSDELVVTATALALAETATGAPASGASTIYRLPAEVLDRRHTPISQRLVRMVGQLAEDAGLAREDIAGPDTGLVSGSRYGCALVYDMHRRLREGGPRGIDAVAFAQATHNFPVSACAIEYGIRGPGVAIVSSTAAGIEALLCAADWLREGRCQRVIVVAYEDLEGPAAVHLASLGRNAPVHEAMALVMLERRESAIARGAPMLAQLAGTATLAPQGKGRAPDDVAAAAFGEASGVATVIAGQPDQALPLVDCVSAGGLLAMIRAIGAAAPQAKWLAGAMDPVRGGAAVALRLPETIEVI